MKTLTKLSLAVALAVSVSACGDKKDEAPVAQNAPATEKVQAPAPAKASLSEQLSSIDAKLLEPIVISDKKSEAAIDDFNKLVEFNQKYDAKGAMLRRAMQAKVSSEGKYVKEHGKTSPEFDKAFDELLAFSNEYMEAAKKLDLKDEEVKRLAERAVALTEFGMQSAGQMVKLSIDAQSESAATQQEVYNKIKALQSDSNKANQILAEAINAFMQKYQ